MKLSLRRHINRQTSHADPRKRSGVSIVEILVAMTLFGGVAVAMGGLSLVVARRAEANDVFTKRTATIQQQMNILQAVPYDDIVKKEGTTEIADGAFPHTREITVAAHGSRTRVTVKIIPTRSPTSVEQITFDRAKPSASPLCRGC